MRGRIVRAAYCSLSSSADGTNHVGVDRPQRHAQRGRCGPPPALRLAQRVLVADDKRRLHLGEERQQAVIRRPAQHEGHAAAPQPFRQLRQPFDEKPVVPQVRALHERVQAEEHHHRLAERVGGVDRDVERGIVGRALRALHPVHDAAPIGIGRTGAADAHPRVAGGRVKHGCGA
jgi:hypothetical protein